MLTFKKFQGINNVQPAERLTPDELTVALNVDAGLSGELSRRDGYATLLPTCHKNLHQARGFMLATVDGGDLVTMGASGGGRNVIYPSLGVSRVWYCNLPDGRTAFSNGLICGIADVAKATAWGVPSPAGVGAVTPVSGALAPGEYLYQLTHVRLADGLEGAPTYAPPVELPDGGIVLTGLPTLAGHSTNIYISGFLAGNTTNGLFSFTGRNELLALPCRTEHQTQPPAGSLLTFWRGRVLIAVGSVLYASNANGWERCDMRRDFKQFSANITLVQPTARGVFVGTEEELAFLAGTEFDKLVYTQALAEPVVLGSGAGVPGEHVRVGDGVATGQAMICIAGGALLAGLEDGSISILSSGRYATGATEVVARFDMRAGVPQYIAIPQ